METANEFFVWGQLNLGNALCTRRPQQNAGSTVIKIKIANRPFNSAEEQAISAFVKDNIVNEVDVMRRGIENQQRSQRSGRHLNKRRRCRSFGRKYFFPLENAQAPAGSTKEKSAVGTEFETERLVRTVNIIFLALGQFPVSDASLLQLD